MDSTTSLELIRRRFAYCQHPRQAYEIAGCRYCGGDNVTYSEFADKMYCYDCVQDYIPEHWGIFDGPIPIDLNHMLGIRFDRVELLTGRIIKEGDTEWSKTWP